MAEFRLFSPAFDHDGALPERFTGDGGDRSPPLAWSEPPAGTKELMLVCDDPDGLEGVFTHWVVYGIPPEVGELPEGLPADALIDQPELVQGLNEYEDVGYTGPVVEDGEGPHRIFFRLYALDAELDLQPGASRSEVRKAAKDRVIAQAELVAMVAAAD